MVGTVEILEATLLPLGVCAQKRGRAGASLTLNHVNVLISTFEYIFKLCSLQRTHFHCHPWPQW